MELTSQWDTAKAEIVSILRGLTSSTNLIQNPSFEVDVIGATSVTMTPTRTTGSAAFGSACLSVVGTNSSVDAVQFFNYDLSKIAVSPNTDYAWTFYGRVSQSGSGSTVGHMGIRWYDASDVLIAHNFTAANPTFTDNATFTRCTYVKTSPVNAAYAVPNFEETAGLNTSKTLFMDACQFEAASTPSTYFDGTFGGCAWTGTEHQSASTRTGVKYVYANPPGTLQDTPCFLISPPSGTTEQHPNYRKRIYEVPIRCFVNDQDKDQAANTIDQFRELLIPAFDRDVSLGGGATYCCVTAWTEGHNYEYGGKPYSGFDATLTVHIDEAVQWAA